MTYINRQDPSYTPDSIKGANRLYGIHIGFVKNNQDPQNMGRLQVYIPDLGGDPDGPETWYTVSYASPFAGATDVNQTTPGTDMSNTQLSYGWWAVPPDLNNMVLCGFANGDAGRGFWFACIYQQFMNHMVPGIAAGQSTNPADMAKGLPPVCEYNKWDPDQAANFWNPQRPTFTPLKQGLDNQGLNADVERGPSSTSARREAPSQVFGFNSPRGNTIHIDDNPQNEFIRLRTRSGAQLLIHETTGYIYMISREGNSWVEISDIGIDMYSKRSISMRAEENINLKADSSVVIHGVGAIHATTSNYTVSSKGQINMQSCGEHIRISSKIKDNSVNNTDKQGQSGQGGASGTSGPSGASGASGSGASGASGPAATNNPNGGNFGLSGANNPSTDPSIAAGTGNSGGIGGANFGTGTDGSGGTGSGGGDPTGGAGLGGAPGGTSFSGYSDGNGANGYGGVGSVDPNNAFGTSGGNYPNAPSQDGGVGTVMSDGQDGQPGSTINTDYGGSSSTSATDTAGPGYGPIPDQPGLYAAGGGTTAPSQTQDASGGGSASPAPSGGSSTPASPSSDGTYSGGTYSGGSTPSNTSTQPSSGGTYVPPSISGYPTYSNNPVSAPPINYSPAPDQNSYPSQNSQSSQSASQTPSSTPQNQKPSTSPSNARRLSQQQVGSLANHGGWVSGNLRDRYGNPSRECVALSVAMGSDVNGNKLGAASGWKAGEAITGGNWQSHYGEAVATMNDNGTYSHVGGVHGNATHTGILVGWDQTRNGPILLDQWNGRQVGYSHYGAGSKFGTFYTIRQ